jgi:3-isopropylmalate/(R)-2-methylmalate dehydratase small subunit
METTKKKLRKVISTAIPLDKSNIDTDQIIPARFLKATTREGFGQNLFRDWRFDVEDNPNPDFVLNDQCYSGEILIAGHNFGSGSSREHAAWALADYGFTVIVSSFFGDIFRNNALNNSLLPVQVSEEFRAYLIKAVKSNPSLAVEVNLEAQTISVPTDGKSESFEINAYKKECIINGYDDVDYLVSLKDKVKAYEQNRVNDYSQVGKRPWIV